MSVSETQPAHSELRTASATILMLHREHLSIYPSFPQTPTSSSKRMKCDIWTVYLERRCATATIWVSHVVLSQTIIRLSISYHQSHHPCAMEQKATIHFWSLHNSLWIKQDFSSCICCNMRDEQRNITQFLRQHHTILRLIRCGCWRWNMAIVTPVIYSVSYGPAVGIGLCFVTLFLGQERFWNAKARRSVMLLYSMDQRASWWSHPAPWQSGCNGTVLPAA